MLQLDGVILWLLLNQAWLILGVMAKMDSLVSAHEKAQNPLLRLIMLIKYSQSLLAILIPLFSIASMISLCSALIRTTA